MPYTIKKSDGTTLTTINDGTFDYTTNLVLSGPNAIAYGVKLNENLVFLLENFASNTTPAAGNNLIGQLWYDRGHDTLRVFTPQGYWPVGGAVVANHTPSLQRIGDFWFNTITNQLSVFDGATWNNVGPQYTKSQGVSGAIPLTITDNASVTHNVVQIQYNNTIIGIFSSDSTFTPSAPIAGFATISPGLNVNSLIGTTIYGNSQVATYLANGTDATVLGLYANDASQLLQLTAANAAIVTANTYNTNYTISTNAAMKSYVDAVTTAWTANAVQQAGQLTAANAAIVTANTYNTNYTISTNAAMKTYVDAVTTAWTANAAIQEEKISTINANITASNTNISTIQTSVNVLMANIGSYQTYTNANIVTQTIQVQLVNANLATYRQYANANIGTLSLQVASLQSNTAGLSTFQSTTNTSIQTINANVGAFQNYANLQLSTLGGSTGPLILKSYTNAQLANLITQTGAVAFSTTTNTPTYYVSPHWYFYSNNAILV
jgi:hypothetical protein